MKLWDVLREVIFLLLKRLKKTDKKAYQGFGANLGQKRFF